MHGKNEEFEYPFLNLRIGNEKSVLVKLFIFHLKCYLWQFFQLLSRYLIAKDESGKGVGVSHFRFDLDNDTEVLYWYVKK